MLEFEIISADNKIDIQKFFKQWVEDHPNTNLIGMQSHIIPFEKVGAKGIKFTAFNFYITFFYQRGSNLRIQ